MQEQHKKVPISDSDPKKQPNHTQNLKKLDAYCNQEDTKKDKLEVTTTAFRRQLGDLQSFGKARWK